MWPEGEQCGWNVGAGIKNLHALLPGMPRKGLPRGNLEKYSSTVRILTPTAVSHRGSLMYAWPVQYHFNFPLPSSIFSGPTSVTSYLESIDGLSMVSVFFSLGLYNSFKQSTHIESSRSCRTPGMADSCHSFNFSVE